MSQKDFYKYPVENCDIVDKKAGEAYRLKREQWLNWLFGNDPHSISIQISSMLWDYALFCTVNELRRIAEENPREEVGFNGPVMRLFDAGFATIQATAIRRLTERPKNGRGWEVLSLRRLLRDICESAALITRENYICYDGLPYNYDEVHGQWLSELIRSGGNLNGTLSSNGPKGWISSQRVHRNFDKLSQVAPNDRKRNDVIRTEIFEYLEAHLEVCDDIKRYVDKFIAHAADPETRQELTNEQSAITLEKLEKCHKAICKVASFVSGSLLWESNIGGVPVPQYDHLKNIWKGWVSPADLSVAYAKWQECEKEASSWEATSLWPPGFKTD